MKKDKAYYLNLPYTMVIKKKNEFFVANYKEYPRIIGCGKTKTEALQDLDEAFESLVDALLEIGDEIKEPKKRSKKWYDKNFYNETNVKMIKESMEQLKNGGGTYRELIEE